MRRLEARINHRLPSDVSVDSLTLVTQALVNHIPFENLDVLSGLPIDDSFRSVFDKIVLCQRGGLCFEMNALMLSILSHLKVPAYRIAARMVVDGQMREEANHLALLAIIDNQKYLIDVGDGRGLWGILPLQRTMVHHQLGTGYSIDHVVKDTYQLIMQQGDDREVRYQFIDKPLEREEFDRARRFIEHDRDSVFNKKLIVSLVQGEFRHTLTDTHLIKTGPSERQVVEYSPCERDTYLEQLFGLRV